MKWTRFFTWIAAILATPIVLAVLYVSIFGWNWLRSPIERIAEHKTGRQLLIHGDLSLHLGWPWPTLRANAVTFANPPWAQEPNMVSTDAVEISVDVPQLLRGALVFPTVHLVQPTVFLERGPQGKKNWLLDVAQQNEQSRVQILQLTLDKGTLGYDDRAAKTHIRSEISSVELPLANQMNAASPGLVFKITGKYQGLALTAKGTGGTVLALRDETAPYPLDIDLTAGRTRVQAKGTVTGLVSRSAVDMHLAISGDSLDQLYPLLGIPAPATHAYAAQGHLVHSGLTWGYEGLTGHIGGSDITGSVQVAIGGTRTAITADLTSKLLELDDLAPVVGMRSTAKSPTTANVSQSLPEPTPQAVSAALPAPAGVLPDLPFKADHWGSMDADVRLRAKQIRRAKELPLDDLNVHLVLRDSLLTLTPLDFGVAGGHLRAELTLDGRSNPIRAKAQLKVSKLLLSRLLPTAALNQQANIGEINGLLTLTGTGNSVQQMLATADGKVGLLVHHGEVSQLLMEEAGLHLWEILQLKMTGDKRIALRCAVADFDVKNGLMTSNAFAFDTAVATLLGSGNVDLAHETLDLTLTQKTKNTSLLALTTPIYIRGSFAHPSAGINKGKVAARAAGSLALGLLNPLLALIPLIDPGPGEDSDCAQLLRDAKAQTHP
ncbi:MAG: AsmA family protein [Rhodoferax sp.]